MADRHAIEDLFVRYAEANDKRDTDLVASTMTEDATMSISIADADTYGPFEPRNAVVEFIGGGLSAPTHRPPHAISNVIVLQDGGGRAQAHRHPTPDGPHNRQTEGKKGGHHE